MGDVIVAIDGRSVRGRHEVLRETMLRTAGERLAFTLRRAGQRVDVAVTTGLRPGDAVRSHTPPQWAPVADPEPSGVGITINPVPPFAAQRLGLPRGIGVMITDVLRGGAADRAGLRVGDVIVEADGNPVRVPEDLVSAVRDRQVVMLVRRNATQEYVGIELAR
jgi:S1-C subfamily serine protease